MVTNQTFVVEITQRITLIKMELKKKTQRNTTSANKIRLQITHDRIRPSFYVFSWEEGFISEFKGYFLKRK